LHLSGHQTKNSCPHWWDLTLSGFGSAAWYYRSIWVNNIMQQYILPMARNLRTGQTVKTQDLSGLRYTLQQRVLAESAADQCAAKMTARTGDTWQGFVREYTPRERT